MLADIRRFLGPIDFFAGAMSAPVARNVKSIYVVDSATFTVLDTMYNAGTAGAADPTTLTFPAGSEIEFIKRFQLATGIIQVIYFA